MFYYIMLCLLAISSLTAMDITPQRKQEYARENFVQEAAALKLIKESGISFTNKNVLDIGCGTGNISNKLIEKFGTQHVHGFDASKNMIEYAQKTYTNSTEQLSFEYSFAEGFTTNKHS